MNTEELNSLLEKYYNGESTEKEEKALKEFFSGNNVPEGYAAEKEIFSYYLATEKIPEPSAGFEARILAGIDSCDKRESQKLRKLILTYMSSAAGLLLLAASYFFIIHRTESQDTFTEPKMAYLETMKILLDVSTRLNHGTQALEPVSKINKLTKESFSTIIKSATIVEKNLKNLDFLNKAFEITDIQVDRENK
jgi:hypothetical protein